MAGFLWIQFAQKLSKSIHIHLTKLRLKLFWIHCIEMRENWYTVKRDLTPACELYVTSGGSRVSRRRCQLQSLLWCKFFCQKLHENERIWTDGWASLAHPLGSVNDNWPPFWQRDVQEIMVLVPLWSVWRIERQSEPQGRSWWSRPKSSRYFLGYIQYICLTSLTRAKPKEKMEFPA